jgi:hypothetical protein
MRPRSIVILGLLAAALAAPAHAQQQPKADPFAQLEALLNSGALVRGVVREEDVTLLFDHIRASILAASQGREAPPPPEAIARRGEEIGTELKVRGTAASLILLNAFETVTRQVVRDLAGVPPTAPR